MVPDTIHLHPEFTGSSADITLLAGHTGFRVNKAMLAMASPVFARMVRDAALTANIVETGDEPAELYAFLKLMRIGPGRVGAAAGGGGGDRGATAAGTSATSATSGPGGTEGMGEKAAGSTGSTRTAPVVGEEGGKSEGPIRPARSELRRLSPVTEESESASTKSTSSSSSHKREGSDKTSKAKPLSDSTTPNKPRILVSRPGTGVKALDRALRDAQAKAQGGVKKKKSRVRFQDPSDPVPPLPPVPVSSPVEAKLPPSHPFGTAVPRSPTSPISLSAEMVRSRSGSSSSGSGSSGIEVTVEPPSPPQISVSLPTPVSSPPKQATPLPTAPQETSPAAPAAFEPSIPQLLQIHALTSKYPGFYTHAVLDFHVELNSPSIVASLGSSPSQLELFRLLELTHRLRSSKLWSLVLGKLASEAWWRSKLDPWSFGEVEVGVLGQDLFSVLAILAAVHVSNPPPAPTHHHRHDGKGKDGKVGKKVNERQKEGVFSQVDKVCITYDEGESGSGMWRVAGYGRRGEEGAHCKLTPTEGQISIAISEHREAECACGCPYWQP